MDNGGTVRPVQDDQLEQVRRPVWCQEEVSVRILADLVDGEGMDERVLMNVLGIDAVAQRRTDYLHPGIVLRNWVAAVVAATAS